MDNNDNVYNLLKENYPQNISKEQIGWPIFIDFRKSEEFTKFKNEHEDDFEFVDVD